MVKQESELGRKLAGMAGQILTSIHAAHAANFQPVPIDRRLVKLVEELGEVSEAWLGTSSSSNYKGKNEADVREEKADVFIVSADLMLRFGRFPGESLEALVGDMRNQFSVLVLEEANGNTGRADTTQRIGEAIEELGKLWSASRDEQMLPMRLHEVHRACTMLLLTPEALLCDKAPILRAGYTLDRLQGLASIVNGKLEKWSRHSAAKVISV